MDRGGGKKARESRKTVFRFSEVWDIREGLTEHVFEFNPMPDADGILVTEEIHIQHTISTNTFQAIYSGVGGQITLPIQSVVGGGITVSNIPYYLSSSGMQISYYTATFNINTHEAHVLSHPSSGLVGCYHAGGSTSY